MRAREDIVRALRCRVSGKPDFRPDCPYLQNGLSERGWCRRCDANQVILDAAEMLEADTKTISALVEDRKYYMEKYEELKNGYSTNDVVSYKNGNYERKFTNVVLR